MKAPANKTTKKAAAAKTPVKLPEGQGWLDTGSRPGTAWEQHDDPEQQP